MYTKILNKCINIITVFNAHIFNRVLTVITIVLCHFKGRLQCIYNLPFIKFNLLSILGVKTLKQQKYKILIEKQV